MSFLVPAKGQYRKINPMGGKNTLANFEVEVEVEQPTQQMVNRKLRDVLPTAVEGYESLRVAMFDPDSVKVKGKAAAQPSTTEPAAPVADPTTEAEAQKLNKDQLKAILDGRGISYNQNANKDELVASVLRTGEKPAEVDADGQDADATADNEGEQEEGSEADDLPPLMP